MDEGGYRKASYSRWSQYIQYFYPGLRLARSKEDLCDACFRLDCLINDSTISADRRQELELEKSTHLTDAITQRRAMRAFNETFTSNMDPHFSLSLDILPDEIDDEMKENDYDNISSLQSGALDYDPVTEIESHNSPIVTLQAEDYGGNLSLPHYGYKRPSADYFNSNLLLYNFVQSDLVSGLNKFTFYDERAQGKGGDALCNMRLDYHLMKAKSETKPTISISILDNCVGQNKNNTVMKFHAFLSLCLYERVVLLYLLPGHSHMHADRAIAWMKDSIRKLSLFTPDEIVEKVSSVKSLQGKLTEQVFQKPTLWIYVKLLF